MNINLNNYESFFLLYVDNELSAAEKVCVDGFIKEYPHLAEELQVLQGLILPAEEFASLDKNNLYRSVGIEENMQEAMLLHLDNELPASASKKLTESIDADKILQQNWQQLLQTRLPAEAIIFEDKESLYKKEPARIVSFRFVKWAVAAAILAAGFFTAVTLLRQQAQTGVDLANSVKEATGKDTSLAKVNNNNEINQATSKPGQMASAENPEIAQQKVSQPALSNSKVAAVVKQKMATVNTSKEIVDQQLAALEPKKAVIATIEKNDPINVLAANKNPEVIIAKSNDMNMRTDLANSGTRPPVEIIDREIGETKRTFAKLASLEQDEDVSSNSILGIDADAVGRTKAGVFFKKLKRTVTRSAHINTGKTLKIAGFEFALN